MGLAAKGVIAYAFTYVIGEAIFFYLSTGEKLGKDFFKKTIPKYIKEGKRIVTKLIKRKRT